MQMLITFMAVVAGLVFSVAVALLVEEFIFGQVFRLFFTPQSGPADRMAFARLAVQPVRIKQQH
jgi:hypothetical protein